MVAAIAAFRARWVRQAWARINEQTLMGAIRTFSQKNDAWLLIKSRKKDPISPSTQAAADQCLYDEDFYPATILKCFAIADLSIQFNSTGVIEAAACGVPTINIVPDPRDYRDMRSPVVRDVYQCLHELFNFPGVCQSLTIQEAIQRFPVFNLDQFRSNPLRYQLFDKEFIGSGDRIAASRIVTALERLGAPSMKTNCHPSFSQ